MSKLVLTDAFVQIAGVDASSNTRSVQIDLASEEVDVTPLGSVPYRLGMAGATSADVALDVYATKNSTLEQALRIAYASGTSVAVQFRPHNTAQSLTNPEVDFSCVVLGFAPFGGSVGEAAMTTIKLAATGTVVINDGAALVLDGLLVVA